MFLVFRVHVFLFGSDVMRSPNSVRGRSIPASCDERGLLLPIPFAAAKEPGVAYPQESPVASKTVGLKDNKC